MNWKIYLALFGAVIIFALAGCGIASIYNLITSGIF